MPIYHYRCTACGHDLEVLQKMNDVRLQQCPACEQPTLRKQVTAAAFKLKGSGWYETDFKNSGSKPTAKKDKTEGDDKTAPSSSTADDSSVSESSNSGAVAG